MDDYPVHPVINVGNIIEGEGDVEISPDDLYRGNLYRNFKITFKAKGPMYSDPEDLTTTLEKEKAHILINFPFPAASVKNLQISRGTTLLSADTTLSYPEHCSSHRFR